jgi:RNA-binding protein
MPTTSTATTKLTGKQARFLRGLGHALRPAVMIGRQEVTETTIAALDASLAAHELVKVKIQEGCLLDRNEVAAALAAATGARVAQILGKTILFFRPAETPVIKLP